MRNNRTALLAFVLVVLLLALPSLALAQSEVPPDTPPTEGILTAALDLIVRGLANLTFLPIAAGFVVVATALLKKIIPINPAYIALALQVTAWGVWVLALHFGYGDQFASWITALTTILTALAGLAGSTLAAEKLYTAGVKAGAPLIGSTQSAGE